MAFLDRACFSKLTGFVRRADEWMEWIYAKKRISHLVSCVCQLMNIWTCLGNISSHRLNPIFRTTRKCEANPSLSPCELVCVEWLFDILRTVMRIQFLCQFFGSSLQPWIGTMPRSEYVSQPFIRNMLLVLWELSIIQLKVAVTLLTNDVQADYDSAVGKEIMEFTLTTWIALDKPT